MDTTGFFKIEDELQRRRAQKESVAGKDKPFRVEFRFSGGGRHWEYFTCLEDAHNAEDSKKCSYGIWGNPIVERPTSRQIQVRGPRGGWSKHNEQKQ